MNLGPAKYDVVKPFGSQSVKFSIGKGNLKDGTDNCSPGPAAYINQSQINPMGKFPLSKNKNLVQVFFGCGNRFKYT